MIRLIDSSFMMFITRSMPLQVIKLMKKRGTSIVLIDSAGAGDIVSMAGLAAPAIGHTIANVEVQDL